MILAPELKSVFDICNLSTDPSRVLEAKRAVKILVNNQVTYWQVEKATGVPWLVIAAIHYRESNQNFRCHLHNGDPLTSRTLHVPKDRPVAGMPPFTWPQSAVDALAGRAKPFDWDVGGALEFCERYNGLGYRNKLIASPYVWSGTDRYVSGLFVADGSLDPDRKDPRPGVAALYKTLGSFGIALDFTVKSVQPNISIH